MAHTSQKSSDSLLGRYQPLFGCAHTIPGGRVEGVEGRWGTNKNVVADVTSLDALVKSHPASVSSGHSRGRGRGRGRSEAVVGELPPQGDDTFPISEG
jgi:hypothetical protein